MAGRGTGQAGQGTGQGGAAAFTLPALTQYADAGDMARWFAGARAGEIIVYATGPMLGDHAAKRLALRWQGEGRADLFQRRAEKAHCFEYCARKRAVAGVRAANDIADTRKVNGAPPTDEAWRASREGRVYALLFRDVADGRCCPSNATIADRLDLNDRYAAKDALAKLKSQGLIRFEESGRGKVRVVTIVATGKSSAEPMGEMERG